MEGAGGRGANGGKWGNGRMGISFVLLAGCAAFDIFTDVGGGARPPKFSCDELATLQVARVAGCFVVMAMLENSAAQGFVIGNKDTVLIGQDACVDLPVGKAGVEGKRDVFVHGMEGLKNKGVTSRGRFNTVG